MKLSLLLGSMLDGWSMHDIIRDYVMSRCEDLPALHGRVLGAIMAGRPQTHAGWPMRADGVERAARAGGRVAKHTPPTRHAASPNRLVAGGRRRVVHAADAACLAAACKLA